MITLNILKDVLLKNEDIHMQFMLPDKRFIPFHFRITEGRKVQRDLVDRDGISRSITSYLINILVGDDFDYRSKTTELRYIVDHAGYFSCSEDVAVEVEYGQKVISQYPIIKIEVMLFGLLFILG